MTELKARILKGTQAEYERTQYSGANQSGVRPIGDSVLVLMDQVANKTSGGIILTDEKIGTMNLASESGVICAVGVAAFRLNGDGSPWMDAKPKPGDRVFTERYAGREIMGADGLTYRLMTYTCIAGLEDTVKPKPKGRTHGHGKTRRHRNVTPGR